MEASSASRHYSAWLSCQRLSSARRLRLICLPHAGAGGEIFRTWNEAFPDPWLELWAVSRPGAGSNLRAAPFSRLEPLLDSLEKEIGGLLDEPYALFGHSLGGQLAFELASRRQRAGQRPPEQLFLAACAAPPIRFLIDPADLSDERLPDTLRRLGGSSEELLANEQLLALLRPGIRADLEVAATATWSEGPLECPLSIYGGKDDESTRGRELLEGWRDQTTAACQLEMMEGGHFDLLRQPQALWDSIRRQLATIATPEGTWA